MSKLAVGLDVVSSTVVAWAMRPKLLILSADPSQKLTCEAEFGELRASLATQLEIIGIHGMSPDTIASDVHRASPEFLHIACHVEEDGRMHVHRDGSPLGFDFHALKSMLKAGLGGRRLKQIVLSTCYGAYYLSELLEIADVVIGFRGRVPDRLLTDLMPRLYRYLFTPDVNVATAMTWAQAYANYYTPNLDGWLVVEATAPLEGSCWNPTLVAARSFEVDWRVMQTAMLARVNHDHHALCNLPGCTRLELCDYGDLRSGRLIKHGNLSRWELGPCRTMDEPADTVEALHDGVVVKTSMTTTQFEFEGAGSYYLVMWDLRRESLVDWQPLDELARRHRQLGWASDWHVITERWIAERATLMLAGRRRARLEMAGTANPLHVAAWEATVVNHEGMYQIMHLRDVVVMYATARMEGVLRPRFRTDTAGRTPHFGPRFESSSLAETLELLCDDHA